ncbi:FAGR198Cp [Eremothecium gossypii FDAG1]|nr:FAGR198Cp [Eremothecium gossypii FDAG1]
MGRRKIAIEPITQDRNRTVTFIKRKAGLFKKAHELAVLCQVDVSVIILGNNNTFYEFSSVDTEDLLRHYRREDLPHDVKTPADYGKYTKKAKVVLNERRRRKQAKFAGEERAKSEGEEEEEEERAATPEAKGARADGEPYAKRFKAEAPKFNPLQQHVQRQFHNLYSAAATFIDAQEPEPARQDAPAAAQTAQPAEAPQPPQPQRSQHPSMHPPFQKPFHPYHASGQAPAHDSSGARGALPARREPCLLNAGPAPEPAASPSAPMGTAKQATRPVLRVQIPTSNSTGSIKSQPSSHSSNDTIDHPKQSQFTKNGQLELPNPSGSRNDTPMSATAPGVPGSPLVAERPRNMDPMQSVGTGLLYNALPSAIAGSPSIQQYFATPLQPVAGAPNIITASQNAPFQAIQRQLQSVRRPGQNEPCGGPMSGTLPSKYVNDLMVASPNGSMAMFQEWPFNRPAPNASAAAANPLPSALNNNGSSGLTPYINGNAQTPLGARYFNFPNDTQSEEKPSEEKS